MNETSQYKLQYEVFVKILQNHNTFELMKSKIAFIGKNQFLMGMLGEF